MIKKIAIFAIIAFALLMVFMLVMASSCVTVKPVPDTLPSYYKLAKQAEQITNAKQ